MPVGNTNVLPEELGMYLAKPTPFGTWKWGSNQSILGPRSSEWLVYRRLPLEFDEKHVSRIILQGVYGQPCWFRQLFACPNWNYNIHPDIQTLDPAPQTNSLNRGW